METRSPEAEAETVRRYYLALRQLAYTQRQYESNLNAFSKWTMSQRGKWALYLENRPHLPLAQALKVEIIRQRLLGKT